MFLSVFDQNDFACRDCLNVSPVFRSDWFNASDDGTPIFILPVVQFTNGRTQFIDGRHRVAVLLPLMERLPIALAHPFAMNKLTLKRITNSPLDISTCIDLPDLKVVKVQDD